MRARLSPWTTFNGYEIMPAILSLSLACTAACSWARNARAALAVFAPWLSTVLPSQGCSACARRGCSETKPHNIIARTMHVLNKDFVGDLIGDFIARIEAPVPISRSGSRDYLSRNQ